MSTGFQSAGGVVAVLHVGSGHKRVPTNCRELEVPVVCKTRVECWFLEPLG